MQTMRSILEKIFEVILLDENLSILSRMRDDLLALLKKGLIEYLKVYVALFVVYPNEIHGINHNVACHQLSIDNSIQYVAQ